MCLGRGGSVGGGAITRPSRGTASRGRRLRGGGLLLIVLLTMGRLRCHSGHGVRDGGSVGGALAMDGVVWWAADRRVTGGVEKLPNGRWRGAASS